MSYQKENNQALAMENVELHKLVSKLEKLLLDLWSLHVHDRLNAADLWRDGWIEGYKNCKEHIMSKVVDYLTKTIESQLKSTEIPEKIPISIYASQKTLIKIPIDIKDKININDVPYPDPLNLETEITNYYRRELPK